MKDESAFPITKLVDDPAGLGHGLLSEPGLTKREYFAGLAMQGLMTTVFVSAEAKPDDVPDSVYAKEAVLMADALIAELSRRARDEGE